MDPIMEGLGRYTATTPSGHLRLHDVCEVLRRAGLQQGFIPLSEHKLLGSSSRVDWVWQRPRDRTLAAAFEVEGRNVSRDSLREDYLKFSRLTDTISWIILFQVDHDLTAKGTGHGPHYREEVARMLDAYGPHRTRVAMDVDLWDSEFRYKLTSRAS